MTYRSSNHSRPSGYPTTSSTGRVADAMALYGHAPTYDEPDRRELPGGEDLDAIVTSIFEAFTGPMEDTGLEPHLQDLLWSLTNLFHAKVSRTQRQLDDNEDRQRNGQQEQDGSEIRSVELERLTDKGIRLLEARNAFERMRDTAAEAYENHTGSTWRPYSGSKVNHSKLTSAVVDSRDFIAAKRQAETTVHLPHGPKVVFSGGLDCNDHIAIWAVLDKVLEKHPGMVLVHGNSDRGAERIASRWADNRKVTQIPFKPEWVREGRSAPFKRNDRMLAILPIGVVVFPGSGITDNIADKARRMGIPVSDYRKASAT